MDCYFAQGSARSQKLGGSEAIVVVRGQGPRKCLWSDVQVKDP